MADTKVDAAVVKKTQDILGKFIKKPALTEKLLNKPPFRFIHDIISAIIKETGFLDGLFTKTELNSENIKDRDAKIKYLQKLIDAMKIITNTTILARPSKIVAGQEADKTNELLQLIGKAIDNKLDYKQAIDNGLDRSKIIPKEKLKNGTSKSELKNKASKKENDNDKNTAKSKSSKTISNKSSGIDKAPSKTSSKSSSKTKENIKGKEKYIEKTKVENLATTVPVLETTENIGPHALTDEPQIKTTESKKNLSTNAKNDENRSIATPEIAASETTLAEHPQDVETRADPVTTKNAITEDVGVERMKDSSASKENQPTERKRSSKKQSSATSEQSEESRKISEDLSPEKPLEVATFKNQQVLQEIMAPNGIDVKRESTFVREDSQKEIVTSRPKTSLRPPSVRPASARPGAPRRRDKNVEIILQPNDQVKLAGINVKLESFESQLEDDGETLVIVESLTTLGIAKDENKIPVDEESQQGHLVQQILQTQKELTQSNETGTENDDTAALTKRQSSARQMDSLRDVIQNLTRSINPLGKLMDFLPEDIDSMHLELNMWRDSYIQASSELKKEKSLTESALEPLRNQLEQIRGNVKEHKDMIDRIRAKILQNSNKIHKLLAD